MGSRGVRWGNVVATALVGLVVYLVLFVALAVMRPAGESLGMFSPDPLKPLYAVEVVRAALVSLGGLVLLRRRQVVGPGASAGAASLLVHALLYAVASIIIICGPDLFLRTGGVGLPTLLEAGALLLGSLLAVPLARVAGPRRG